MLPLEGATGILAALRGRSSVAEQEPFKLLAAGSNPAALTIFTSPPIRVVFALMRLPLSGAAQPGGGGYRNAWCPAVWREVLGGVSADPTTQVEYRLDVQPADEVTCSACGATIEDASDGHATCPACGMVGYVDRSAYYLLPLSWACPACGAENKGDAGCCASCDFELPATCLRCGSPLTGVVCESCGGHQARLFSLQLEADRRAQRPPAIPYEGPPHSTASIAGWAPIRRPIFATLRRLLWPILAGAAAVALIAVTLLAGIDPIAATRQALAALRAAPWLAPLQDAAARWWAAFRASLADPPGPTDPEYSYLFATVVFQIALFPFAVLFLRRAIRSLFR